MRTASNQPKSTRLRSTKINTPFVGLHHRPRKRVVKSVQVDRELQVMAVSDGDLERIIRDCGSRLGYTNLKNKQIEAITSFIEGKETFIALPTGYGKSLVYAVLPIVFDIIRGI